MLHTDRENGLNANQLKLIAIAAMTLDHLIWTLFPGYSTEWFVVLCHIIGRLTAPIMWFFIAEGYHYTHNIKKYAARLFLLAAISHFAYNFCFGIPFIPFRQPHLTRPASSGRWHGDWSYCTYMTEHLGNLGKKFSLPSLYA